MILTILLVFVALSVLGLLAIGAIKGSAMAGAGLTIILFWLAFAVLVQLYEMCDF